jgi:hypothetical protein
MLESLFIKSFSPYRICGLNRQIVADLLHQEIGPTLIFSARPSHARRMKTLKRASEDGIDCQSLKTPASFPARVFSRQMKTEASFLSVAFCSKNELCRERLAILPRAEGELLENDPP